MPQQLGMVQSWSDVDHVLLVHGHLCKLSHHHQYKRWSTRTVHMDHPQKCYRYPWITIFRDVGFVRAILNQRLRIIEVLAAAFAMDIKLEIRYALIYVRIHPPEPATHSPGLMTFVDLWPDSSSRLGLFNLSKNGVSETFSFPTERELVAKCWTRFRELIRRWRVTELAAARC
jgi:hypothetical protein